MEYVALTGISDSAISELKDHQLRTIEIRTPQNFFTSLNVGVGDDIFLTHTSIQDLTRGNTGIIAKVIKHQLSTHRTITGNDMFFEEHETMMIRLQLQAKGIARISKVLSNEIGKETRVVAEDMCFYEAR
ncbi:hypothetical protein SAMN04488587_0017 [Methanococcoides vulcani]|uniref:DUF473 domain-containing protein n=1 Tax=Methanococcoides vulcani TaxID=1353158 RepID=A0A1I0BYU5_9EURY|nr:DUF473 domain-containing protein [Methanococcoides vulcani]SET11581.1 hypothetical protein SAMN04488587_0017 [Methanococcoides vulcani]